MNSAVRELHDAGRQVVNDLGLAPAEDTTWSLVAELGWLMVATPEELGGLGMGPAAACALHQELGRGLATAAYLPAMLSIDALGGSSLAGRENWLERLVSGQDYVAASLAHSPLDLQSGADGELRLQGPLLAVPSADRASHVLVCASGDEDIVALVSLDQPGIECLHQATWDQTRRLFELGFTGTVVDPELVLARGHAAAELSGRLDVSRDFALAAESVGGAAALLEMTVEYLQTRQQFARPLAMFQALKHRCADLKALVDAAEALLHNALDRAAGQGEAFSTTPEAVRAGQAAKQLACRAYATVAEESLQLHGGIGMTSEHDCHLFLKRAMLNEHLGRQPGSYEDELAAGLLQD